MYTNDDYTEGIKKNRSEYSEALVVKNNFYSEPVELETSDKSWRKEKVGETFCKSTALTDFLEVIPGMTYGLQFVLSLLNIHYVSQMLAGFIKNITPLEDDIEVPKKYTEWLKSIAKGTIAEETNMEVITFMMTKYAEEKELF